MSMLSVWVKKQVRKRGMKAFMLKILDIAVNATPSKKDDELLKKVKQVLKEFDA